MSLLRLSSRVKSLQFSLSRFQHNNYEKRSPPINELLKDEPKPSSWQPLWFQKYRDNRQLKKDKKKAKKLEKNRVWRGMNNLDANVREDIMDKEAIELRNNMTK